MTVAELLTKEHFELVQHVGNVMNELQNKATSGFVLAMDTWISQNFTTVSLRILLMIRAQ